MLFFEQITEKTNLLFEAVNGFLAQIFFLDILFFVEGVKFPLVVFVLFSSGIFFTFKMGFVNIRLFRHSVLMALGLLDKGKNKKGEISHFKALTTALSPQLWVWAILLVWL